MLAWQFFCKALPDSTARASRAWCGRSHSTQVVQQRCNRGATEVQQRCNRGATEVEQRWNRGGTEVNRGATDVNRGANEVQQRCNRGATEVQQRWCGRRQNTRTRGTRSQSFALRHRRRKHTQPKLCFAAPAPQSKAAY
jgi:hypothetical protein